MPSVQLVLPFVAREFHLLGVNYYDVVANVLIGRVGGLVLPAEDGSHSRREATHGLILGIDQMPGPLESPAGKGHDSRDSSLSALRLLLELFGVVLIVVDSLMMMWLSHHASCDAMHGGMNELALRT